MSREITFLFLTDIPQALTRSVTIKEKLIFLPALFIKKYGENFTFPENSDLGILFKPYLLPKSSKWKAAAF